MNADNIFEIDSENSSFESQDILQDVSDNNITTTIATTSNDINIAPNISNNPITLNNKKSGSQPSSVKPFFLQTLDGKMVICSIYKNQYSINMATGNLHKHLDTHHPGWDSDKQSGQQCLTFTPEITISKQILIFAPKNKFNALIAEWIVSDTLSFFVVSTHWIDNDWKLKKILFDIRMLPTGKEIDKQLHDIFAAFDSPTKILCATTNGGSSVILAMQLLKKNFVLQNNHFDFQSHHCLAHILNLIITAGLTPIKSSIENVQNLVKVISSSLSITQDFRELEKSVGESEAILAATQMFDKLQKYTDEIYDKMAFIAAILDPHIKLELIPADMNMEVNRAIFNNVFRSKYFAPILNNSSTNSETPLNLSYTEQVAHKRRTNTLTDRTDEFTQYLNKAVLPISVDLLNWWKLNSTCFPHLPQMAKDYLAIQSTSVPSEQVFSKAGDT
ncbi:27596_t:CDS:2, partial [Gigaspora margarita]